MSLWDLARCKGNKTFWQVIIIKLYVFLLYLYFWYEILMFFFLILMECGIQAWIVTWMITAARRNWSRHLNFFSCDVVIGWWHMKNAIKAEKCPHFTDILENAIKYVMGLDWIILVLWRSFSHFMIFKMHLNSIIYIILCKS